jgi:hypothetical protein
MLGVLLIVMVGESVQEMQLACWLPQTTVAPATEAPEPPPQRSISDATTAS